MASRMAAYRFQCEWRPPRWRNAASCSNLSPFTVEQSPAHRRRESLGRIVRPTRPAFAIGDVFRSSESSLAASRSGSMRRTFPLPRRRGRWPISSGVVSVIGWRSVRTSRQSRMPALFPNRHGDALHKRRTCKSLGLFRWLKHASGYHLRSMSPKEARGQRHDCDAPCRARKRCGTKPWGGGGEDLLEMRIRQRGIVGQPAPGMNEYHCLSITAGACRNRIAFQKITSPGISIGHVETGHLVFRGMFRTYSRA